MEHQSHYHPLKFRLYRTEVNLWADSINAYIAHFPGQRIDLINKTAQIIEDYQMREYALPFKLAVMHKHILDAIYYDDKPFCRIAKDILTFQIFLYREIRKSFCIAEPFSEGIEHSFEAYPCFDDWLVGAAEIASCRKNNMLKELSDEPRILEKPNRQQQNRMLAKCKAYALKKDIIYQKYVEECAICKELYTISKENQCKVDG